jgi:serine/threonine-protein kinase HipA
MRRLEVRLRRAPSDEVTVGTLAENARRIYFEYAPTFLSSGLELSPFRWRARPGLIEHTERAFGPLPGLFEDSLPDSWGRLLMDRHFRRLGMDPAELSPLDRLAYLGTRTMGSLTYHPPSPDQWDSDQRQLDLFDLGRNAEAVVRGDAATVLPELIRAGGSPGGARPKVLVGLLGAEILSGEDDLSEAFLGAGGEYWLIKFAAQAEAGDAGPVEYAYSLMAQAAGVAMPPTRLFEVRRGRAVRRYFGVRRFDRTSGNQRIHLHTFGNLVQVDFRIPSTDYEDLFKVTRVLTKNHLDLLRLFRLMAFNVAARNRDDHAKNFSFLMDGRSGAWSLAPAYDLTYASGPGGEHTTTIAGEGRRPTRAHCLGLAARFGLAARDAEGILEQINGAVAEWPRFADEACCSRKVKSEIGRNLTAFQ